MTNKKVVRFFYALFIVSLNGVGHSQINPPLDINKGQADPTGPYYTGDKVPGDPKTGYAILERIFVLMQKYKVRHQGIYPSENGFFMSDVVKNHEAYGFTTVDDVVDSLSNPDNRFSDYSFVRVSPKNKGLPAILAQRPDGSLLGGPKQTGALDVIAFSSTYFHANPFDHKAKRKANPTGFYLVLYEDGNVRRVPYDQVFRVYESNRGASRGELTFTNAFPNQPGVPHNTLSYEEYWTWLYSTSGISSSYIPIGTRLSGEKDGFISDNGAFEGLLNLSRRLDRPIERENSWQAFETPKAEFSLAEVQASAQKLEMQTQVQELTLSQLQKSGSAALLFLKDDGRIVTLIALDSDRAVVVDRGLTRNVERSVLEARYSGEALVPTKALAQQTGVVADDAVRSLQLKSLDDEVPQQVTLRNTGQKPVTLQLEYPLLGVTESKLSRDTLAPGESATLDLKVKWRSILKAPTQNVLVSLQTSDPIVPRLQLAILLLPPQAAAK